MEAMSWGLVNEDAVFEATLKLSYVDCVLKMDIIAPQEMSCVAASPDQIVVIEKSKCTALTIVSEAVMET